MKFFLPSLEHDPATAEQRYQEICDLTASMVPLSRAARRIFSVDYVHAGRNRHAEVGRRDPQTGSLIICIVDVMGGYLVQTRASLLGQAGAVHLSSDMAIDIEEFERDAGSVYTQ